MGMTQLLMKATLYLPGVYITTNDAMTIIISSLPCSAQAGFNRGDGVDFYVLPSSMDSEILTLSNTSYVNVSGVWIFEVDESVTIGGNL